MEPIHVFFKADGIQDSRLVDMLGKWQLYEDAMHILIGIIVFHNLLHETERLKIAVRKFGQRISICNFALHSKVICVAPHVSWNISPGALPKFLRYHACSGTK